MLPLSLLILIAYWTVRVADASTSSPTPMPAAVAPDLDASLQCWHPFTDPADVGADWSVYRRNAVLTGTIVTNYTDTTGGRANASALRVSYNSGSWTARLCPGMSLSGPLTLMLWVRSTDTSTARALINEIAPEGHGFGITIRSNTIVLAGFGAAVYATMCSSSVAANRWHHCAISVSAWSGTYLNGVGYRDGATGVSPATRRSMGLTGPTRYSLGINVGRDNVTCTGSGYCSDTNSGTWIAGLRVYSRALSLSDIEWIRASEAVGAAPATATPTAAPNTPTAMPSVAPTAPTLMPTLVPTTAQPTYSPVAVQPFDSRLECMYTFEDGAALTDSSRYARNGIVNGGGPLFEYPAREGGLGNTSAMRVDRLQGTSWAAWLCPGVNHSGASTVTFWVAYDDEPGNYDVFSEIGSGIGYSTYNNVAVPGWGQSYKVRIGSTSITTSYQTGAPFGQWFFVALIIYQQSDTQYDVGWYTTGNNAEAILSLAGTRARGPLAFGRDPTNATCTATCMPAAKVWIDNLRVYSYGMTIADVVAVRNMDLNGVAVTRPPSPPAMAPTGAPSDTDAGMGVLLQCMYRFDPAAPGADASGRGRAAVITGSPVFGYPNLPGDLGNVSAMRFDMAQGTGWSVRLCENATLYSTMVVSFWVAFTEVPNTTVTFLSELDANGLYVYTSALTTSAAAMGSAMSVNMGSATPSITMLQLRTLRWQHVVYNLYQRTSTTTSVYAISDGTTGTAPSLTATLAARKGLGLGLNRTGSACTTGCMPSAVAWITNVRVYSPTTGLLAANDAAWIRRADTLGLVTMPTDPPTRVPTPAPASVAPDLDAHLECWHTFDDATDPGADWSSRGRAAYMTGSPQIGYPVSAYGIRPNSSALRIDADQGTAWGVKLCQGMNFTGPYTLSYWILTAGGNILEWMNEQSATGWYMTTGGSLGFRGSGSVASVGIGFLNRLAWVHMVIVVDGRTASSVGPWRSYRDGVMNSERPVQYTGATTGRWLPLGIGYGATGSLCGSSCMFNGYAWIDSVRIYSKALTEDEVAWIRAADDADAQQAVPSAAPTDAPTGPSAEPTAAPTAPTAVPTAAPTTAAPTPRADQLTPNLGVYLECAYTFEDGVALTDSSTHARTGVTSGAPLFEYPALPGGLGNTSAMRIDLAQGTSWAVWLCPGAAHANVTSVSFWHALTGPVSTTTALAAEIGSGPTFVVLSSGLRGINVRGALVTSSSRVYALGTWIHVVMVLDAQDTANLLVSAYVNGDPIFRVGSNTRYGTPTLHGAMAFGRDWTNVTCTTTCMPSAAAYVDNFRVYSAALTPADVRWIYAQDMAGAPVESTPPPSPPAMPPTQAPSAVTASLDASLECYYTFGDNGAAFDADSSARGRAARISGAPIVGFPALAGSLPNTSAMRVDRVQDAAWSARLCNGVTHEGPGTISFWIAYMAIPVDSAGVANQIITELNPDGIGVLLVSAWVRGIVGAIMPTISSNVSPDLPAPAQWFHVVMTVTSQSTATTAVYVDVYVNGRQSPLVVPFDAGVSSIRRWPLGLGLSRWNVTCVETCMPGVVTWIDNVRVYSTGVTAADVAWIRYLDTAGLATAPAADATPSGAPTDAPSAAPVATPTAVPSAAPTTTTPSPVPTDAPSAVPSGAPSAQPSGAPSAVPSAVPSAAPTTSTPSAAPSATPSAAPSAAPTTAVPSATPTRAPSAAPTTATPSGAPTAAASNVPTGAPTTATPSAAPTTVPSGAPSAAPTAGPSAAPTTVAPTGAPSAAPSTTPSGAPTAAPSSAPTTGPSAAPTQGPSATPTTAAPSSAPSAAPSATPSGAPTATPSAVPTQGPSAAPTTAAPSSAPSAAPSATPTTAAPTGAPSAAPTQVPTVRPTEPVYDVVVNNTVQWTGDIDNAALSASYPGAIATLQLGLAAYPGGAADVRRMRLRALALDDLYGTATDCRYPVSVVTDPLLGFDLTPSAGEPALRGRPVRVNITLSHLVYFRRSRTLYHCVDALWQSTVHLCGAAYDQTQYEDVMSADGRTLQSVFCHATPFMVAETLGTPAECIEGLYGCRCTERSRYDTSAPFIGRLVAGAACLAVCAFASLYITATTGSGGGGGRAGDESPSRDRLIIGPLETAMSLPGVPPALRRASRRWCRVRDPVTVCAAFAYAGAILVAHAVTFVRAGDPDTRTAISWRTSVVLVWVCYLVGVTLVWIGAVVARQGGATPTLALHAIGALLLATGNGLLLMPTPGDTAFTWAWLYVPVAQLCVHVLVYQEYRSILSKTLAMLMQLATLAPMLLFLTLVPCGTAYLD